MKRLLSFLFFAFSFTNILLAQSDACGTDALHARMLTQDPTYAQRVMEQSAAWAEEASGQHKIITTPEGEIYEIPVVVHIIHSGQAIGTYYNPSDQQIQDWVDYLNAVFAAQSSLTVDTTQGGVRVPIRLALAARDPNCNASNGIVRVDGSVYPNYPGDGVRYLGSGNGVSDTTIKALSLWPRESYYNIWLVNKIDNGAWSGYATFPAVVPYLDGAMMSAYVVQPPITNLVFPHELGHSLGLLHTFWGGSTTVCPPNNNCLSDGDEICDTEPHLLPSGCPSGINSCTGANYNGVQYNIMNYSSCRDRFTAGQSDKMVFTLLNYRHSLLTSYGAMPPGNNPPGFTPPLNLCVPVASGNPSNNFNVGLQNVSLADLFVSSGSYNGDGNQFYVDHTLASCLQPQALAHLHKDSSYVLTVTCGANPENVRGWIDFDNDGVFAPSELVINRNGTLSFEAHTATVTIPTGIVTCTPLRMRISSDMGAIPQPCSNPQYGQTEDYSVIITTANPTVSISVNPGTTISSGSTVIFTATSSNSGNAPQYQWCRNGQPIASTNTPTWSATAGVDFMSGDGITVRLTSNASCTQPGPATSNALAMQVSISTGMASIDDEIHLSLYPNPTTGTFVIEGIVQQTGPYEMMITNLLGQTVYAKTVTATDHKIDVSVDLKMVPPGIYYLRVACGTRVTRVLKIDVVR